MANLDELKEARKVIDWMIEGKKVLNRHKICGGDWKEVTPHFPSEEYEYRLKPEPRTVYVNEYRGGELGDAYESKRQAVEAARMDVVRTAIPFREVMEDEA